MFSQITQNALVCKGYIHGKAATPQADVIERSGRDHTRAHSCV